MLAGSLWRRLLPAISDMQFWQVLTFAAVLLVYAATEKIGGSELFAVMAFGATLANLSNPRSPGEEMGFWIPAPDHSHQIHSFHSELAFLVRSFLSCFLALWWNSAVCVNRRWHRWGSSECYLSGAFSRYNSVESPRAEPPAGNGNRHSADSQGTYYGGPRP